MKHSLITLPALLALGGVRAIIPNNVVSPASTSGSLTALKYTNVGGSGSYDQVTNMIQGAWPSCTVAQHCITSPKQVSGPLAPFDEEITAVLRGPMTLHNIAVYQPSNSSAATWKRTSVWQQGSAPDNLVFMSNKGGSTSGEWDTCGGASQAYSNGAFTDAAASPNAEIYSANLPSSSEVNIVTATSCQDVPCDGFSRGTASHGWGGSKAFIFEFDMPSDGSNPPAIWLLNQQVVNAAQYGCNCRGMGDKGGCGELDLFEVLPSNLQQGITEIYSFKGATGGGDGNFFARPTSGTVTYMAILDVQTDSIIIERLTSWDFTQTQVTRSIIDGYLSVPAKIVPFGGANSRRSERPKTFMHRRNLH